MTKKEQPKQMEAIITDSDEMVLIESKTMRDQNIFRLV
jgi:hypothetical protein